MATSIMVSLQLPTISRSIAIVCVLVSVHVCVCVYRLGVTAAKCLICKRAAAAAAVWVGGEGDLVFTVCEVK